MAVARGNVVKEMPVLPAALLSRVVEHYHRTFCERPDAQAYMTRRGLVDVDLLKAFKVGYADGSLKKLVPEKGAELRDALLKLGVLTQDDRELLGGCIVIPIPEAASGEWTTLYGRGLRTPRHCYLPGPLRGVLNHQAARSSSEIILTESVIDALSFHQAGVSTAIPIYGTNGFTADHFDLMKGAGVRRVILALDGDSAGRRATASLKEKLSAAGLGVRVMPYPAGVKDANEMLVQAGKRASEVFSKCLAEAEPRPVVTTASSAPAPIKAAEASSSSPASSGAIVIDRAGITYEARVVSSALGKLRATIRASRGAGAGARFHVDSIDLYASRSRSEFARRAGKVLGVDVDQVEADLLAVLVEAEKLAAAPADAPAEAAPEVMSAQERAEAKAFLERKDLLDAIAHDIDVIGYVGEETIKRLTYLVAVSRKLDDPLSIIFISQSGAGKSGAGEVVEKLTPPEDVMLVTRLTPQSLYYVAPGSLDHKLILIEERHGSAEAEYPVRVLQSRKALSVLVPIKNPQTGRMESTQFEVEARAAFIEATTSGDVNHENSTRCFELALDESEEQTKRIHERQRLMRTERGLELRRQADEIKRRHWNGQRLLEPLPVIIPYADRLTFPTTWMRTRRDHARFLNLIEVSAFLHQYQRERRGGAIVASLADYEIAYALASQVLLDTLSDLSRTLRETYEKVRALCEEKGTVSRRDVREALRVHDSRVRRHLDDLVELEYLAEVGDGKTGQGRLRRYRLVERGMTPCELAGLLTPAELAERLRSR
jgi:Toprim domain-containing protein